MKLKKKTNVMLMASAVVAAVGIASVSFAAWADSGTKTIQLSSTTGTVAVYGFTSDAVYNENAKLFPYDQTGLSGDNVTVYDVKIPAVELTQDCTLTIEFEGYGSLPLYYKVDGTATADANAALSSTSGFDPVEKFTSSLTANEDGSVKIVGEQWLHVILESSDAADMSKSFNITIKLVQNSGSSV